MKYTIEGIATPPSFKNGKQLVRVRGQFRVVTNSKNKKWMNVATAQLTAQRCSKGIEPAQKIITRKKVKAQDAQFVNIVIHRAKGRLADIDGAVNTIMDCLVKAKILADDSPRYVQSISVSWCEGKENLTEIWVY